MTPGLDARDRVRLFHSTAVEWAYSSPTKHGDNNAAPQALAFTP